MNRETRKANLRKLQLTGTVNGSAGAIRKTRSCRESSTKITGISSYFSTQLPDNSENESSSLEQKETIDKSAFTSKMETVIENENAVEESLLHSPKHVNKKTTEETEKPKRTRRTKLANFLNIDSKEIPVKQLSKNDDFETTQKKAKCAPKAKTKNITATKRTKASTRRQQDIKSAFLRNEQLFSEITAQHCLADNFNPEEMQLALAMSKSEAEKSGITVEDDDIVVNIVTDDIKANESIRTKLKRYGFRTAPKEEFSSITAAFFAGANRRQKSKWGNKFTALTVRNSEQQLKKVNGKIDDLFAKQCCTKSLSKTESYMEAYQLNSTILIRAKPAQHLELFKKAESLSTAELKNFYIEKLFEISRIRSGHLLKDWTTIQGRDLSPSKKSTQQKKNDAKWIKIYMELEEYFCGKIYLKEEVKSKDFVNVGIENYKLLEKDVSCKKVEEPVNNVVISKSCDNSECELDEMLELIKNITSPMNNEMKIVKSNSENSSPNKEPPEKKLKSDVSIERDVTKQNSDSLNEKLRDKDLSIQTQNNCTKNKDTLPYSFLKELPQSNRATSPDIFANSDVDTDEEVIILDEVEAKFDLKNNLSETCNGIMTFRKYSSDEVKNSQCVEVEHFNRLHVKIPNPNMIVDLTQEDSNSTPPKINFEISPSKKETEAETFFAHKIFDENEIKANGNFFELEDLSENITLNISLNSPTPKSTGEDSFEATNDTIFEALQRKYLGSEGYSPKCKRKSVSMTKINETRSSHSHSKSKRYLSFTQMEQPVMHSDTIFTTPIQNDKISSECLTKLASPFPLEIPQHSNSNTIIPTENQIDSSIDLTQNEDSADEFIILSDDEINYSIWKADKSMNPLPNDNSVCNADDLVSSDSKSNHTESAVDNFSYLDLLDVDKSFNVIEPAGNVSCTQACLSLNVDADIEPIQSQYLATQTDLDLCSPTPETPKLVDLSKERAEFGILECYSEPFTESQFKTATKQIKEPNASYLFSPSETTAPMKRYSSSTSSQKFNELLKSVENSKTNTSQDLLDNYDEFDRLVFGTPTLKSPRKPIGFEQLLTAEISFHEQYQDKCYSTQKKLYVSPSKNAVPKTANSLQTTQELQIDGKSYVVSVITTPKPEFTKQTDAELLKQLYNFGIKPLKRGQALKMLEYIYNQTHPILVNENLSNEDCQLMAQISQKVDNNAFEANVVQRGSQTIDEEKTSENLKISHTNKFNLSDCCGDLLLRHRYLLNAELVNEEYVFQTNSSKKISQALLPLHVAWFNLVCSNVQLHEAILMYEPIDLQEVYIFFKTLGYRYDPKDLKTFFDRRCIIFRYDLTQPGSNRHLRKKKKKTTTK